MHPPKAEIYKVTRFQTTGYRGAEDFYDVPKSRLVNAIMNLVEKEGPIHSEVVKRRIAGVFDVRLGKNISRELDSAIHSAMIQRTITIDGLFLWPPDISSVPLRIYDSGQYKRTIEEIPPQELSVAIMECVTNSVSITEIDLVRETSRLFGLRATENVSRIIQVIIRQMQEDGTLRAKADRIMARE